MDEKILLVDDEKDIADLLEEVLIQDGFRNIRKACTGMDALAVCREFQPDVMILDIMLPDLDAASASLPMPRPTKMPSVRIKTAEKSIPSTVGTRKRRKSCLLYTSLITQIRPFIP